MTRKWGKAGERLAPLTTAEKQARAKRLAANASDERAIANSLDETRRAWEQGRIFPYRITMALDMGGHYGPEVDIACLAEEPAVDEWEAGTRYPTWEQLLALADLTSCMPKFFTIARGVEDMGTIFICYRGPGGVKATREAMEYANSRPDPIEYFTGSAIAEVVPRG